MQDELNQFKRNEVWDLVPCLKESQLLAPNRCLGTSWTKRGLSQGIKQGLLLKGITKRKGLTMRKPMLP